MGFKLTPDHEAIIADVRAFAKKEIAPLAAEIDAESKFPAEIIKKNGRAWIYGHQHSRGVRRSRP